MSVEPLEDRNVPAITGIAVTPLVDTSTFAIINTLIILGDQAAADTITLTDNGTSLDVADGVNNFNFAYTDVEAIVVDVGGGNDTVTLVGDFSFLFAAPVVQLIQVAGGDGVDTLDASGLLNFSARLRGEAGNDTLIGGASFDDLDGGGGDDSLVGNGGGDGLFGGDGLDTLIGGPGNDFMVGGNDADTINGDAGNDTIFAQDGDDLIDGGTDNDSINGDLGADTITGGDGNDSLNGGGGDDLIDAGNDNDSLRGESGFDTLLGGAGTNTLIESFDTDFLLDDALLTLSFEFDSLASITQATLTGGNGNNTLDASAFTGVVSLDGGAGNDTIFGTANNDTILGNAGNDDLHGGGGNDLYRFSNGFGTDFVTELAAGGTDTLDFSAVTLDIDVGLFVDIDVSEGANQVTAFGLEVENIDLGSGNDDVFLSGAVGTLLTGAINGNGGIDGFNYFFATNGVNVNLATGVVSGIGGLATNFENVFGSNFADVLVGSAGPNGLTGNGGNDTIDGGAGNDFLEGGNGDDSLVGGLNDDTYFYFDGWGSDTLVELPGGGFDTINLANVTVGITFALVQNISTTSPDKGTFETDEFELLIGGQGNDLFLFQDGAVLAGGSGIADGGPGADVLDYSAYTSAVTVDLTNFVSTGLSLGTNFTQIILPAGSPGIIVPPPAGGGSVDTAQAAAPVDSSTTSSRRQPTNSQVPVDPTDELLG